MENISIPLYYNQNSKFYKYSIILFWDNEDNKLRIVNQHDFGFEGNDYITMDLLAVEYQGNLFDILTNTHLIEFPTPEVINTDNVFMSLDYDTIEKLN